VKHLGAGSLTNRALTRDKRRKSPMVDHSETIFDGSAPNSSARVGCAEADRTPFALD
jgi:hypothetical protein